MPDLLPPDYISAVRAERRQKLRDAVDGAFDSFEKNAAAKQLDDNFNLAYRLMSSPKAREAFAIEKEPDKVRDRYGRTRFGQCCLMARRLIEAGVRFVTVNMFETVFDEITWDIHGSKPFTDIQEMSKLVAPNFDQAYSARCWKTCTSAGCCRTRWCWRWANSAGRRRSTRPAAATTIPASGRSSWAAGRSRAGK